VLTVQAPVEFDGRLIFRSRIRGWRFDFPLWRDDTTVPLYVRPSMPPVHFEFLQQVTHEFFRSSVLFPAAPRTPYGGVGLGIDVVPLIEKLTVATKKRNRRLSERAAREEVQQELARLLACREDPSRPGC
jgi:hypothetical protein